MKRWEAKVITVFGMFLVLFACMLAPIKLSSLVKSRPNTAASIVSLLRCFAGGVFLGTILLHLLPEVQHSIHDAITTPHDIHYPVAELIVLGGFFLICVFEKFIMNLHQKTQNRKENKKEEFMPTAQVMLTEHQKVEEGSRCALQEVVQHTPDGVSNQGFYWQDAKQSDLGQSEKLEYGFNKTLAADEGKVETSNKAEEESKGMAKTRIVILLVALAFECIFDGLSVGLQKTNVDVWNMFIAVISHEFIIAFCLGLELINHYSRKRVVLAAAIYASVAPVGCVIGITIMEVKSGVNHDMVSAVNGVLLGLAAGIFLYCTFMGMMGEELIESATYKKILAVLLGCALMVGLVAIPHHHHHDLGRHEHHHHEGHHNDTSTGETIQ